MDKEEIKQSIRKKIYINFLLKDPYGCYFRYLPVDLISDEQILESVLKGVQNLYEKRDMYFKPDMNKDKYGS